MLRTCLISTRIRRYLFAGLLIAITGKLHAQAPPVPGLGGQALPPAAGQAVSQLANGPGLTINTAGPCCKPPTIWDFLGFSQIHDHLASTSQCIHELPLVKNLGVLFQSGLAAVGLANPAGPPGLVPAGPGGPGGPGAPGAPGGPEGPGAVAAKIEADKQAAAATIQNLKYLGAQDCNRYPEVIPAILQELDNPDELVRFTALCALKPQCKDFRCSTLPATRIYFRLQHKKLYKPCGCCAGCQCQDQVIARLSDLLLDKNTLGGPKESSFRVREMATRILSECVSNRGRNADQVKTRQVEPDPERGPLPDPENQPPLAPIPELGGQPGPQRRSDLPEKRFNAENKSGEQSVSRAESSLDQTSPDVRGESQFRSRQVITSLSLLNYSQQDPFRSSPSAEFLPGRLLQNMRSTSARIQQMASAPDAAADSKTSDRRLVTLTHDSSREAPERQCSDCQPVTVTPLVYFPIPSQEALPEATPANGIDSSAGAVPYENPTDGDFIGDGSDIAPYFAIKPLPQDVYDRALDAINVGPEAMAFPECDDDDLKPYNNRSAINLAPFALFNVESAQTGNVFRLGYRTVFGYANPDRSEYLWAKIGSGGPLRAERNLNYQDLYVYNENGSDTTSAYTEIPVRFLDPKINPNTAGPGDLVVGIKTVMLQDPNYRISSVLRTITPIGSARRGLGHGFLAMEPGLLSIWRIGRETHLFGELKYHFPIGADSEFSGQVLTTGLGITHVLWSDVLSPPQPRSQGLLLTVETIFTTFLTGRETLAPGVVGKAAQTVANQHVGLRRMWSDRFSTGVDFGVGLPSGGLYDFSFLTQVQWVY